MKKTITFILIGIASFCNAQNSGVFVGSCEPGMSEGITGNFATFDRPRGITTDSNGYLYVADTNNNSIRKISPNGNLVTTISSSGINKPFGIVVDQSGNIYVSDPENHRIQKITPTGVVSTFAGSSQGYANGIGTAAKFDFPFGLTIDASGNIYVADSAYDNVSQTTLASIRKITPSGLVSTFYTTNQDPTGYLFKPIGVAIDSLGNLYVADSNSIFIRKISASGQLISTFNANAKPWGIALDRMGNIYLTINFYTNHPNPGYPNNGLLVTLGRIGEVRKITPNGYVTFEVQNGSGLLYNPLGLCVNNNNEIFIADVNNNRIAKLTSGGIPNNFAGETCPGIIDGQGEINKAHFNSPNGLGKDSNGNIYIADKENNRIRKITPNGVVSTLVGSIEGFNNGNANQALLDKPRRMFVDSNNNIYTLTKSNLGGDPLYYRSIRKISQNGDVSSFPQSNPNLTIYDNSSVDGGIVVDQNGNVYVTTYNLIQKITPLGIVSIFAGDWSSGYINGFGTVARFNNPSGLCIDPLGNIYVADSGNNRIRKITPSGLVSTLGSSTIIIFNRPNSIAFNGGNVYFNDFSRMYKITANDEVYLLGGGGGGSLISNANNLLVISGHKINIVTDQALETNQNSFTNNEINLFPNPAKDQITIDFGTNLNVIGGNYKILNTLGQEVQNGTLNSQQNIIQLSNIKGQGVYFVKVYDSSNSLLGTKKIIIQQ